MRINITALVLGSGLTTGLATSNVLSSRSHALNPPSLLEQNRRAVEQLPPACNLNACIGLSGTLTCVVSAITTGDPSALQQCLTNGLGEASLSVYPVVCSCAACIASLNNFLNSLGICVTGPEPPGNVTVAASPQPPMTRYPMKAASLAFLRTAPTTPATLSVSQPH
ncbi:uncharacterized protein N7459_003956 [Penicillium hispanicum]|uniref:uncharacterized protein n=1 Tax=Penicillium hispanicum TaxID=1080232 RepID=UPI002541DA55|nr:uncharacterized protein N7459_003956 [Penicillium hispanicum]KAJ5584156.1 hypothetical protein N7459_003956 [Penicillium hispanicum]